MDIPNECGSRSFSDGIWRPGPECEPTAGHQSRCESEWRQSETNSAQQAAASKLSVGVPDSRLQWVDATGKSFAAYDNQAAILVINGKNTYMSSMYYTC